MGHRLEVNGRRFSASPWVGYVEETADWRAWRATRSSRSEESSGEEHGFEHAYALGELVSVAEWARERERLAAKAREEIRAEERAQAQWEAEQELRVLLMQRGRAFD